VLARVIQTIERHGMLTSGMRVGVAVSGGADSVCLLHVLLELAPRWDLTLSVLHLDHQLRGAESRRDAEFVRDLAARLGLPAIVQEADVAGTPGNLEQAARSARLAFFRQTIAGGAVDRVALGHTRSDQAETVLYRLLRGAGTAGLAGIRPVTPSVIRPLLEVERAEVLEFLRARSIAWREDSTNASPRFARNRIRHGLLPQLARDWNPAISQTLAQLADWALAEQSYWDAEIERLAAACFVAKADALILPAGALGALPLAAARRLVRRAIEQVKGDLRGIAFRHIEAVLALASRQEGSGRCQAPGVEIRRSFDWLRVGRPGAGCGESRNCRVPVAVPGTTRLPGADLAISTELIEKSESSEVSDSVYNEGMACLDWHKVSGPLEVRNWLPGDQYRPAGSAGEEKIKTLFQQARIPSWERRLWPILTDGCSIAWARQFGAAAQFAANAGSKVILRIRETPLS